MISPDRGVKLYSTRQGGIPGDIFFEKAKKLFDEEMRYPSITTVQTALVLGSRYGVLGQNSLGWSYSGKLEFLNTEDLTHEDWRPGHAYGSRDRITLEL
jgi:hypothetical protein